MANATWQDWRALGGRASFPLPAIRTRLMDAVEFAALVIEEHALAERTRQASALVVLERILPFDHPASTPDGGRDPRQAGDPVLAGDADARRRNFRERLAVLGPASQTGPGQYALLLRGASLREAEQAALEMAAEEREASGAVFHVLIGLLGQDRTGQDAAWPVADRAGNARRDDRDATLDSGVQVMAWSKLMARLLKPMPVWKRLMDIVAAALGLALLSPLFLVVALYVSLVSPGPIFFRQKRLGWCGQPFSIWKFRTMRHNADVSRHQRHVASLISDENRPMVKLERDPRIIPLGRALRKSCLDELPQLVNVLLGDMSLVGPRPPIPYETAAYKTRHWGRLAAAPGMTGLWQVSGKNNLSFSQMIELDLAYARSKSLALDAQILLMTPAAVATQALGT